MHIWGKGFRGVVTAHGLDGVPPAYPLGSLVLILGRISSLLISLGTLGNLPFTLCYKITTNALVIRCDTTLLSLVLLPGDNRVLWSQMAPPKVVNFFASRFLSELIALH